MGHRIVVRVKPDGTPEISVDGLAGASCKEITRALEQALGQVKDDKKTPDFFLTAPQGAQIQQGGSS